MLHTVECCNFEVYLKNRFNQYIQIKVTLLNIYKIYRYSRRYKRQGRYTWVPRIWRPPEVAHTASNTET